MTPHDLNKRLAEAQAICKAIQKEKT